VALAMTIAGMLVVHLTPTLQQFRANSAASQVVDVLRQAREYAITYRRYVQITFPNYPGASNQIRITVRNSLTPNAGADVILTTVTLSGNTTFQLEAGVPDTPDAYGKASAVNFNNVDGGPPAGMYFQADGTYVDSAGNFLNGSVFLGQTNLVTTARAVTVLGPTGRIRMYNVNGSGTGWFERR
jgi:type II secretory pathway pseudopilin PulG